MFTDRNWAILDVLRAVAAAVGHDPAQVALAWAMARPGIASVIVGARNDAQLQGNLAAASVRLDPDQMQSLTDASAQVPGFTAGLAAPNVRRIVYDGHDVRGWSDERRLRRSACPGSPVRQEDRPMTDDPQTLVTTHWLADRLGDVIVLDASYHLPAAQRDAAAEFVAGHIPGARFFDINALSDPASDLPHMVPPPADFAAAMGALGVGDGAQVVIYDSAGLFSAARAWWHLRHMGLRDVAVLDGGLPKWRAEGRAVTQDETRVEPATLTPRPDPATIRDVDQVAAALGGPAQIVDARAPARFAGDAPEPRAGLRAGHIPGSVNVPFGALLNDDGTMKDAGGLRAALAGVDKDRPVIATCGSGITAAIVVLALTRLAHRDVALYDGSWSEWGARPDLPLATGAA